MEKLPAREWKRQRANPSQDSANSGVVAGGSIDSVGVDSGGVGSGGVAGGIGMQQWQRVFCSVETTAGFLQHGCYRKC